LIITPRDRLSVIDRAKSSTCDSDATKGENPHSNVVIPDLYPELEKIALSASGSTKGIDANGKNPSPSAPMAALAAEWVLAASSSETGSDAINFDMMN
jgi:hypothetical protein